MTKHKHPVLNEISPFPYTRQPPVKWINSIVPLSDGLLRIQKCRSVNAYTPSVFQRGTGIDTEKAEPAMKLMPQFHGLEVVEKGVLIWSIASVTGAKRFWALL